MKKLILILSVASVASQGLSQTPNYVPVDSLVSWWPFSGDADDQSINLNNGTVNGASLALDRFGATDSAYHFDGVDDFISVSSLDNFQYSPVSYSMWYNLDTFCLNSTFPSFEARMIIGRDVSGNTTEGSVGLLNSILTPPDTISNRFGYYEGCCSFTKSSTPTLDEWHHLIYTHDADGAWQWYFDGQLITSGVDLSSGVSVLPFNIGSGGGRFYWDGLLDDIGVWNRVLDDCEVQDLYLASLNSISQVTQTGVVLSADMAGATYQWLDCDDSYAQIVGETNQSYTPSMTGNYAVEVTLNGCIDTSSCMLADFTALDEFNSSTVSIYPNPVREELNINGLSLLSTKEIIVTSATGAVVLKTTEVSEAINVSTLTNGVYFLSIQHEGGVETVRFVKH